MNFSYGIIGIVGVLAAISIGFIAMDPTDIIEPRVIVPEENPVACTMQWDPMCGVDGVTYGNSCVLNAADVKLDYPGECVAELPINPNADLNEPAFCAEIYTPVCGTDGKTYSNQCFLDLTEEVELDYQGECMMKEISIHSSIMPSTATVGDVLLIEVEFTDDDGSIVDHVSYDIFATQDGNTILSEPGSHRHPGKHIIHETAVLSESEIKIKVILQGLGHGDEIIELLGIEDVMTISPETTTKLEAIPEPRALQMTAIVSVPAGAAVPGCEDAHECYLPYEINVEIGATVSWINDDSASHTVTSGSVTAGLTDVFDSGIFMSGSVYEFTFDEAGTYDYFCMVHPWMTGKVLVN